MSGKPKICLVHFMSLPVLAREYNNNPIGGEAVQHTLLAKALRRRGYSVSMIVGDYGQKDGAEWEGIKTFKTFRQDAGIPVLRFIHPRWTRVWKALKRADADIYYVSCAGMLVGLIALFAKRYNRRMIFRVAHDTDCQPDRLMVPNIRDKKLYEYGLHRADAILVQTRKQQAAMKMNYGIDSYVARMLVAPPDRNLNLRDRDIPVLWVNNIRQFKRPDIVFDLCRRLPDINIHMIGGPAGEDLKLFREIKSKAGSYNNLHFHGAVPYHDVNSYYERSRVFINTSDTEGFPNSYLQAWIRGVPVISFFDPDGIISKEQLGVTVETVEEMAEAIRKLTTNAAEWYRISERCKAYMREFYNEDDILAPYIDCIEMLIAQGRR